MLESYLTMQNLEIEKHVFAPRWLFNGFPKSGLHLLSSLMGTVARPLVEPDGLWEFPWAGTFRDNSWSREWVPIDRILYRIGRIQDRHFLKSHLAYHHDIERFLYYSGISHVFIYRDLRDVAVSQSYHVVSDDDTRFAHPNKELYRKMGSHEEVLKAVISGVDRFPGVLERWEDYAPWLGIDWIYKTNFETVRTDLAVAARNILTYGLDRVSSVFDCKLNIVEENFDLVVLGMVEMAESKKYSPTFRKGNIGDWHDEFTPEIKDLFKEHDKNNWIIKLGYEEDDNW